MKQNIELREEAIGPILTGERKNALRIIAQPKKTHCLSQPRLYPFTKIIRWSPDERIKDHSPADALLLVAALFEVLGIGVFLYALIHGIFHITDSLTQVIVPGNAELPLKKRLTYTVFLQEESVVNGKI